MTEYRIDLNDCYSPDDVHQRIAEQLPLPVYYGGNLDALHEVLTDPHPPWRIVFVGCELAETLVGARFMRGLKRMCADAEEESGQLEVIFS